MANFYQFVTKKEREHSLECACNHCAKAMKKRLPDNVPAYCSYVCACFGQPDKVKKSMRNVTGINET